MPTDSEGRSLLRNVTAALGGETIQAGLSVVIFFGLFFQLSDQDWGLYVAATTTGLILGTLMNLGSQELLVRNVSRGASLDICLLYTSPSPRDQRGSRMPSSA